MKAVLRQSKWTVLLGLLGLLCGFSSDIEIRLKNVQQILEHYNITEKDYPFTPALLRQNIVIIDRGFVGFEPELHQLPHSAKLIEKFEDYPEDFRAKYADKLGDPNLEFDVSDTSHGFRAAIALWDLLGRNPEGPKITMIVADGIRQVDRAVYYAEHIGADIVLYPQNSEIGGNGDDSGPLGAIVDRYLDESRYRVWINAAGNYGGLVKHLGRLQFDESGYVLFDEGQNFLAFKNRLENTPVDVIAVWNSFGKVSNAGKNGKDLDIEVRNENDEVYSYRDYDKEGKLVAKFAKSEKKQVRRGTVIDADDSTPISYNPIERIYTRLKENSPQGFYKLYVKMKDTSEPFRNGDTLTITIKNLNDQQFTEIRGEGRSRARVIEIVGASTQTTILSPAGHDKVLSWGDLSGLSGIGPTSDLRAKPDAFLDKSALIFNDDGTFVLTSGASVIGTALVATLKAHEPYLTRMNLKAYINGLALPSELGPLARIEQMQPWDFDRSKPGMLARLIAPPYGVTPTLLGRYPKELGGLYVIGLKSPPAQVFDPALAQQSSNGDIGYDYYIGPKPSPDLPPGYRLYPRKRSLDLQGEADPFPWEKGGHYSPNPSDYVEVRKALSKEEYERARSQEMTSVGRVWKTPPRKDLRRLLGIAASSPERPNRVVPAESQVIPVPQDPDPPRTP